MLHDIVQQGRPLTTHDFKYKYTLIPFVDRSKIRRSFFCYFSDLSHHMKIGDRNINPTFSFFCDSAENFIICSYVLSANSIFQLVKLFWLNVHKTFIMNVIMVKWSNFCTSEPACYSTTSSWNWEPQFRESCLKDRRSSTCPSPG